MEVVVIFFMFFMMMVCLISLAASILTIIGQWKVFEKSGKPGWAAIIPYYNKWVLYEIGGYPPLLILITIATSVLYGIACIFVPLIDHNEAFFAPYIIFMSLSSMASIATLVINILVSLNIAKKFNKSAGYGIGLAFLPFVFYLMLGSDKQAVYNKEAK